MGVFLHIGLREVLDIFYQSVPVVRMHDLAEPYLRSQEITGGIAELADVAGDVDQRGFFAGPAAEEHGRALGDDHLGQAQGLLGLVAQGAFLPQGLGLLVAARLQGAIVDPQILQVLVELFCSIRLPAKLSEFGNQLRFGLALVGGHSG